MLELVAVNTEGQKLFLVLGRDEQGHSLTSKEWPLFQAVPR